MLDLYSVVSGGRGGRGRAVCLLPLPGFSLASTWLITIPLSITVGSLRVLPFYYNRVGKTYPLPNGNVVCAAYYCCISYLAYHASALLRSVQRCQLIVSYLAFGRAFVPHHHTPMHGIFPVLIVVVIICLSGSVYI